jgi:hypothetical protein
MSLGQSTRRRRRRTTYAWGDGKPNPYVIIGCMTMGVILIYFFFFPPDFTWRPSVKVPVTVTPMPEVPTTPHPLVLLPPPTPPPDASVAPTNSAVQPIHAPPAVKPPSPPHPELVQPLRLPSLLPQTNQISK